MDAVEDVVVGVDAVEGADVDVGAVKGAVWTILSKNWTDNIMGAVLGMDGALLLLMKWSSSC